MLNNKSGITVDFTRTQCEYISTFCPDNLKSISSKFIRLQPLYEFSFLTLNEPRLSMKHGKVACRPTLTVTFSNAEFSSNERLEGLSFRSLSDGQLESSI